MAPPVGDNDRYPGLGNVEPGEGELAGGDTGDHLAGEIAKAGKHGVTGREHHGILGKLVQGLEIIDRFDTCRSGKKRTGQFDCPAGTVDVPGFPDFLYGLFRHEPRAAAHSDDLHTVSPITVPLRSIRITLMPGLCAENSARVSRTIGTNSGEAASSSTVPYPVPSRIPGRMCRRIRAGRPKRTASSLTTARDSPILAPIRITSSSGNRSRANRSPIRPVVRTGRPAAETRPSEDSVR